ncbi:uncharacterized protein cubi_01160 [Cryptosporidium ubiquitum]|uniref:Uncharacterized protein n=1 Tax=Cryptosporidium ubiquitum TaxID=857276 RepID=A0A1J4MMS3_9CRYT|nr:uncharacterized protein cubi_01160 [Cryptosporidium ubiquitum]OII74316.1 hypothetical protein cubi_01160 [Cryptosporidium ubiquitum]
MREFLLNQVREVLGFGRLCCSKCIFQGEKETLQCYDLDPPQIVNEITKISNRNGVIGLDCNQKEHEEDLARDAARKVFGATLEKPLVNSEREQVSSQDKIDISGLDLKKDQAQRAIKFEDCN